MGEPQPSGSKHIKDAIDFFSAVQGWEPPAVSFLKPTGFWDGHRRAPKLNLYEAMLEKMLDALEQNPKLKAETAVFITFDEGGRY